MLPIYTSMKSRYLRKSKVPRRRNRRISKQTRRLSRRRNNRSAKGGGLKDWLSKRLGKKSQAFADTDNPPAYEFQQPYPPSTNKVVRPSWRERVSSATEGVATGLGHISNLAYHAAFPINAGLDDINRPIRANRPSHTVHHRSRRRVTRR